MAIDDAEKRKSISGIMIPLMPGVTPEATQDAAWRQESCWSYSGIIVYSAVVGQPYISRVQHIAGMRTMGVNQIG